MRPLAGMRASTDEPLGKGREPCTSRRARWAMPNAEVSAETARFPWSARTSKLHIIVLRRISINPLRFVGMWPVRSARKLCLSQFFATRRACE